MINASLDYLLEDALERQGVPVDACLPQGFQSYLSGRRARPGPVVWYPQRTGHAASDRR